MKTTTRLCVVILASSCLAMGAAAPVVGRGTSGGAEFTNLRMHLEVDLPGGAALPQSTDLLAIDLLDLPAEVVLEAISEHPLRALRVVSPEGKTVFGISYSRGAGLDGLEISIESEGSSLREVLNRYPAGTYRLYGMTWHGESIAGSVELSAHFPGSFTAGLSGQSRAVPVQAAQLVWTPSLTASGYELEIENEVLGVEFSVRLPSTANAFLIPAQLLAPDVTYEYSLSVKGDTDNELEIEGSFTTAP